MAKKKGLKGALISSVVSIALSCTTFVGTTFAWFTDSVSSAENTIIAGNLDIELEYWKDGKWVDVKGQSDVLTYDLWEPGVTEVAYMRVANAGSLALKYQLGVNIVSETAGKNVAGADFLLSDYIQFGVVEDVNGETNAYTNRDAAVDAVTDAKKISAGYSKASFMEAGDELYLALVVYMPTEVGNEANHNGTNVPKIELGINVFATQYTYEEDSFGDDYDKGAAWTGMVDIDWYLDNPTASEYVLSSAEELAGLSAIVNGTATAPAVTYSARSTATIKDNFKGKTIKLGGNIDLNEIQWTPIGDNPNPFLGNFDGQGYTVSNLYVMNEGWAGLIGHAGKGSAVTINNVTIDGATIISNRMAGGVVGQIYGSMDNCSVKNAEIIVTPNAVGDSYDNGDKVGGVVGWLGDNGNNRTLTNCSAENVTLSGYRDVGGIVGYVASSTTVKDNSVTGIEITVDQNTNYYGDKDVNAGYICGRVNGTITEENNTNEDSKVDSTYSKNGLTMKSDGDGNVKLYLVPADYEGDTLNVPEGVTAIGNYAFAYNSNVETVVLSSTVRDLGRGFDSSTVKKVVLNEGLTTISSRAFRSTTALEEVVFSSTVTEIADNAFQKSAIKEIVIPASVTTIGETAFGASLIEKVTFEGNTAIQGYAFRGCTKLRTVIMNGDNVTFIPSTLNGRNSCWFCNSESNNPNTSDITFTVVSDEIKERVLTAMGAERNNTTVIVDDGSTEVATTEGLLEVLSKGGHAKLTANIDVADTIDLNGGIINGNGHTINFTKSGGGSVLINPTGGTIKNVKLVDPNANMFDGKYAIGSNQYASSTLTKDLYVENVEISGFEFAIDVNANGNSVYVKNSEVANWVQVANAEMTTFEGCHLYADVASQMTYNQPNSQQAILFLLGNMTFTNCHFEENVNIYLDSPSFSGSVYFNNSTYGNNGVENRPIDSFGFIQYWFPATGVYGYAGTFGATKPAQTHFNWYINGVQVWAATAI